ncbi:MAG: AAA family ATPase [Rhodothermales bacterium]|nr:AAA family ATPase [Rhodothermales bacterium]
MSEQERRRPKRAWLWAVPAAHFPVFEKTGTFAVRRVGRAALYEVRSGDVLFAYLSGAKVLAGMFEAVGTAFEDTTPLVRGGHYPHRLRVRPLAVLADEDRVPYAAFHDRLDVARDYDGDLRGVLQQVLYPLPKVDEKVLEFLIRARQATDFDRLRAVLEDVRAARQEAPAAPRAAEAPARYALPDAFDRAAATEALIAAIAARGFVYQPWEVAAYATALRTKPFAILAGVTGTGKSKLPALVEEATGGAADLVPVRPDWTDSAEVLGYVDLRGHFRPGAVLRAARAAADDPARHHTAILDEMNLARVEHYFAEVLSRIEDRRPAAGGGFETDPLPLPLLAGDAAAWGRVRLPANLALVGTVNVDESAHGFSRKVLDRAFTLELAEVDLAARPGAGGAAPTPWPVAAWHPRALRLAGLAGLTEAEAGVVERAVAALAAANAFLAPAQLQAAYRTRDEVALFALHAAETPEAFRTRAGDAVDPLDLALHMKLLPRLQGGGPALQHGVRGLLGWATTGEAFSEDEDARAALDAWEAAGRAPSLPAARFPRTAARLCLMWERLLIEGFTSFWI